MTTDPPPDWVSMTQGPPLWDARDKVWHISRHADAMAVLGARDTRILEPQNGIEAIARRAGRSFPSLINLLEGTLLCRNPPFQAEARRFLARGLASMGECLSRPAIDAITRSRVAPALAHQRQTAAPIDAVATLASQVPAQVFARALGVSMETAMVITASSQDLLLAATQPRVLRTYARLDAIAARIESAIADEMERAGDDPASGLSRLMALNAAEFHFPAVALGGMVFFIIQASTMTTAAFLANVLYALAARPGHWRWLRRRPDRLPAAIDELLRFIGPFRRGSPRVLGQAMVVGGVELPAGAWALVDQERANHDPAAFAEPGRLDFERVGPPHLGFGHGPHLCLGAALARLETASLLEALLPVCDIALVDDRPDWWDDNVFRRLKRLPLILTPV